MKFTLRWLAEHLDTAADATAIAERLTALGLEVEAVVDRGDELRPFTVARVIEAAAHPNAEKLKVCRVETASGEYQVVCGAPNARTGMKAVFAPPGTTVPGTGLQLKPAVIRGVESNGMLVSMREMGLSDEHEGIIELTADAVIGEPFAPLLGADDAVLEIKLTPNRQDCLGVRGIARDLAAAGLGRLKPFDDAPVAGRFASPISVRLDFPPQAADACPMFVGRYIRGVKNGPSPEWLQRRLRAIGLRPISALVDITNYVTFDLARPLHVFDADTVAGGIHARLGRPGERVLALDGREYAVDGEMCVICDDDGVLGLGGVMGGESSGVTADTVNVFIESALFDPVRTASTGRRLGIQSDARYRFERGVDPASARPGIEVATRLVLALCGGEPSEVVVAGAEPAWQRSVELRTTRVERLGGVSVPEAEQQRILEALGFTVALAGESFVVGVPSWRSDVDGEADLVEEVVRVHGYDAIPPLPLPPLTTVAEPALTAAQRRVRLARRSLAARGLVEAVTWSFTARAAARQFGGDDPALVLANPISAELDTMRPTPLPNLLAAVRRNADRGFGDVGLFEVGPAYRDDTPGGQRTLAAGVRRGRTGPRHWAEPPRPVDLFDARADAERLLGTLGIAVDGLQAAPEAPAWYHPGRSGVLKLGRTVLAAFGELHPRVLAALGLDDAPVIAFEVELDALPEPRAKATRARPPLLASDLPAVERDFAFVVAAEVAAERLVRAARGVERGLITQVSVFDVYQGPGVPEGQKSVALAVRLEPRERTLTEAEIEAVAGRLVAAVAKATGASLRT